MSPAAEHLRRAGATSPIRTAASASSSMRPRSGGLLKYSGRTPYRSASSIRASRAPVREVEPSATGRPSSSCERPGRRDDHRLHRAVAAHREVGEEEQLVGVAQVLHQRDRPDVEVTGDQGGVEPVRGVLVQVDVEQGTRAHQPPVQRQAVEELDVAHPGTANSHPAILPRRR